MSDQTQAADAAEDNPWPPTTYAWYVVIVLGLSNILSLMDRMVVSFLLGPISEELALSDRQAHEAVKDGEGRPHQKTGRRIA